MGFYMLPESELILSEATEDWDTVQRVNLRGTFLCYKYGAKEIIASEVNPMRRRVLDRGFGGVSIRGETGGPVRDSRRQYRWNPAMSP